MVAHAEACFERLVVPRHSERIYPSERATQLSAVERVSTAPAGEI
jgi:hypothetical protein